MNEVKKSLPQGWAKTSIGNVVVDKVPQIFPQKDLDFVYIDIASIDNETKQIVSPKRIPGVQAPSRARQSIAIGDIVVSMTRPNLNAVSIVPANLAGSIASTGLDVLRPIKIEPSWLFYNVCSHDFVREMGESVRGALYPAIKSTDVRTYQIPIPPLNEQKRIVARIEELQIRSRRAKEALEFIPDLLEQLRRSILAAAFRGDLTKEWREKHPDVEPASELLKRIRAERRKSWEEAEREKLKAKGFTGNTLNEEFAKRRKQYKEPAPIDTSDLPELPQGWCWESTQNVCKKIMDGTHFSPPNGLTGDRLYLTAKNVRPWFIDMNNVTYVSDKDHEKIYSRCDVQYGDVLYVKDGVNAGMAALNTLREPFSLLSSVGVFRPEDDILSDYVVSYLNSPMAHTLMLSQVSGNAITRLTLAKLKDGLIPVPALAEQEKIASIISQQLNTINSVMRGIKAISNQLINIEKSILYKAFRGELAPQDPNDEPATILLKRIREAKAREAGQPKVKDKRKDKKMKKSFQCHKDSQE